MRGGHTVTTICRSGDWYPTGSGSDGGLGSLEGFLGAQPQLSLGSSVRRWKADGRASWMGGMEGTKRSSTKVVKRLEL